MRFSTIFLLLPFYVCASSFSVTIIYPDRTENTFAAVAHSGMKTFGALIPSVSVVMKKRHYIAQNMCSKLEDMVNNIVRGSPKVYVFVIRPKKAYDDCTGKWHFNERLILAFPKTMSASTDLEFDLINGKKYFVGTWRDLVEMISEEPMPSPMGEVLEGEGVENTTRLIPSKYDPRNQEILRKRRYIVLGLVCFTATLLGIFLFYRSRVYRKTLEKALEDGSAEAETTA